MNYRADEVGRRLSMLRKSKGYSREKIAQSIGRSAKYYGDIERGICGMSIETLLELAEFYRVSLDYLVNGDITETVDVKDEQTRWMVKRVNGLKGKQREFLLSVLELMYEQISDKEMEKRDKAGNSNEG